MDDLDGKHARRTGSSSVVGLMMDHGMDAYNVGVQTLMGVAFFQTGQSLLTMLIISSSALAFNFTSLEAYYLGGLYN